MKIRTLVCSVNHHFIEAFSLYAMECMNTEFEFSFFTDKIAAIHYFESNKTDAILADEEFLVENLSVLKCVCISIANCTRVNTGEGCHELNIYQRGADILADLLKILSTAGDGCMGLGHRDQKIITFYSPQGGTGKTTLAYMCAMLATKDKSSVYLNLEEFGYTDHLYQITFRTDMEEVLFAIKDKRDLGVYLSNALQKNSVNVSVMPNIRNYGDLEDFTPQDAEILLKSLQKVSGAEYLFVDISSGLSNRNKLILEISDVSFWVFDDTPAGKGKMERIRNDQSVQGMEYFKKAYFLVNKCKEKSEDEFAIRIPFSESLSKGADVETALSGKRDLCQRCMEILSIIDR